MFKIFFVISIKLSTSVKLVKWILSILNIIIYITLTYQLFFSFMAPLSMLQPLIFIVLKNTFLPIMEFSSNHCFKIISVRVLAF